MPIDGVSGTLDLAVSPFTRRTVAAPKERELPAESKRRVSRSGIRANDLPYSLSDGASAHNLTWRSAPCSTNSCVEVAELPEGGVAVRDGKLQEGSAVLVFTADEWRAFVAGVKQGEFG